MLSQSLARFEQKTFCTVSVGNQNI